jgi:hypothetical protein
MDWNSKDWHHQAVVARSHCDFWHAAVHQQQARVSEPRNHGDPVERRGQEIDFSLYLVAVQRYVRAAELMCEVLSEPILQPELDLLRDEEQKDLRDMDEHFDQYVRGRGKKKADVGDDKYGFLRLVEFKDPVFAYGKRSIKLSRVTARVDHFHDALLALIDAPATFVVRATGDDASRVGR